MSSENSGRKPEVGPLSPEQIERAFAPVANERWYLHYCPACGFVSGGGREGEGLPPMGSIPPAACVRCGERCAYRYAQEAAQ